MKFLIIILAFIGLMSISNLATDLHENIASDQPEGYGGIEVFISHEDNECRWQRANVADVSITVNYIEPGDEIDYYGRWIPSENLIVLNSEGGLDINTVAHEVYHVVQTKMDEYEVVDPHWGAYMQGALTNCVWDLVDYDVTQAKHGKFRFAE